MVTGDKPTGSRVTMMFVICISILVVISIAFVAFERLGPADNQSDIGTQGGTRPSPTAETP